MRGRAVIAAAQASAFRAQSSPSPPNGPLEKGFTIFRRKRSHGSSRPIIAHPMNGVSKLAAGTCWQIFQRTTDPQQCITVVVVKSTMHPHGTEICRSFIGPRRTLRQSRAFRSITGKHVINRKKVAFDLIQHTLVNANGVMVVGVI
jgi:hypothetical protein